MFLNRIKFFLFVLFLACLITTSCGKGGLSITKKERNYEFGGVELGMSVTELRSMNNLTEKKSITTLMNPEFRMFRFNDSNHNSVVVDNGVVKQINVYDFSEDQDVQKKKEELIAKYGEPSFVSENEGRFVLGWGDVKLGDKGWSARGNFITAEISTLLTQVSIVMGDPDGWYDYSSAIMM